MIRLAINKFLIIILLATAVAPNLWAKSFKGPTGSIAFDSRVFGKTDYISLKDLSDYLGMSISYNFMSQKFELRNNQITIDFACYSHFVMIDKNDMTTLSSSIVFIKGEPFVPASFLTTNLKPYYYRLKRNTAIKKSSEIIVLDAGHGGHDTGALGCRGLVEKVLVLDVTMRVKSYLEKKGYKILLTRKYNSTYLSLIARSDFANNKGAAIFVSIHGNSVSSGSKKVSGIETFYLSKVQTGSPFETDRINKSEIKNDVSKRWSSLSYQVKRLFAKKYLANNISESKNLAYSIHNKMKYVAVGKDRGVKTANLSVLRNTYCPATLVEIGFIDNYTDATYLRQSSYKQKIAESIGKGIINYLE